MSIMPYERAAEILDPARGERFTDMEPVNKALYMGRDAILLRIPRSLYEKKNFACANCGSDEYLYNAYELRNTCCGNCGQAIKWED